MEPKPSCGNTETERSTYRFERLQSCIDDLLGALDDILIRLECTTSAQHIDDRNYIMEVARAAIAKALARMI